ncbi:pyruvate kinase [Trichococcus palustris]|jgi:pyruvate kinase|uniref:Pyruvate kinase n=1 Tax=Trichococcus palustris TaxID=140314 RepID=A0A143YMT5_9LACT|nr:pyruvate kinase [Trichococcus palustris]SFL06281.1 pyruvate kinase [Trichococcus palustris]
MVKKTKIVCTIGPASDSIDTLVKMINNGMNVARLNFSHGEHETHLGSLNNVREAARQANQVVGIMLDIQGQKIRTHKMTDDAVTLTTGDTVRISMDQVLGTKDKFSVTYPTLIDDVTIGMHILIDDGLLVLQITDIDYETKEIIAVVQTGGVLKNSKGINVPEAKFSMPGLTEKDAADIRFGAEHGVDYIAASFVRKPSDILEIIAILEEMDAADTQIIAKIENQEGVQNAEAILSVCSGLMVARGDLGVEINGGDVPIVQKDLIRKCNIAGKQVITATQMLDSMQWNPRPTRAEASDVANAIFDGTDAVMLSGESAVGKYPVETVAMMARIAVRAEEALDVNGGHLTMSDLFEKDSVTEAISQAAAQTVKNLSIKTVVAATSSGHTARMISKYRPKANILAATYSERVQRGLSLVWGVQAFVIDIPRNVDDMLEKVTALAVEKGFAQKGDAIVITAGTPILESGTTNLMKIEKIG